MVNLFSKLYKLNLEICNMYLIGIFSLSIPYMHKIDGLVYSDQIAF